MDIIKADRLQRLDSFPSATQLQVVLSLSLNPTTITGTMTQPSSSRLPIGHPYRLATPPSMAWGSRIALVARGRRFQSRIGDRAQLTPSPGVPTEPESSPPRPGRHLRRTHVLPARFRDSIYLPAPRVPEHMLENQTLSPASGNFLQL